MIIKYRAAMALVVQMYVAILVILNFAIWHTGSTVEWVALGCYALAALPAGYAGAGFVSHNRTAYQVALWRRDHCEVCNDMGWIVEGQNEWNPYGEQVQCPEGCPLP